MERIGGFLELHQLCARGIRQGLYILLDDTIKKLKNEATVFLLLGIFMFFCSFVGLYYTVLDIILKRQTRRSP